MGNCQAIDAAALLVQHPNGKVEKFYWSITACEVMTMNPGHYVALLLSTTLYPTSNKDICRGCEQPSSLPASAGLKLSSSSNAVSGDRCSVRLTKIKLLKPTDTLCLGNVYRLITTQEVMKGLKAKKMSKLKRGVEEVATEKTIRIRSHPDKEYQGVIDKKTGATAKTVNYPTSSNKAIANRSRTWQPSLHCILESGS